MKGIYKYDSAFTPVNHQYILFDKLTTVTACPCLLSPMLVFNSDFTMPGKKAAIMSPICT